MFSLSLFNWIQLQLYLTCFWNDKFLLLMKNNSLNFTWIMIVGHTKLERFMHHRICKYIHTHQVLIVMPVCLHFSLYSVYIYIYMNNQQINNIGHHTVTHCTGHVSTNTRPYIISCTGVIGEWGLLSHVAVYEAIYTHKWILSLHMEGAWDLPNT